MLQATRCRPLWVLLVAALVSGGMLAGCRRDQTKSVSVIGSTSILPYAEELGLAYQKKYPERKVDVTGGGSTAGLKAVEDGLAHIGMCSRLLTEEEAANLKPIVIARDGLAVIVHAENPVTALTTEQIRGLFAGQIKNWKEVGGQDAAVSLVTREEGSGTRESFQHLIMGKEATIAKAALVQESTGAVQELVARNVEAIGYMSLGLVGPKVKALKVDNQEPTSANVLSGTYKLARPFLFVTKGTPDAAAQAFIDYVLSDEAQARLEKEGLTRAK